MVKVKMLINRAGPGRSDNVGDEIEVDADEAQRMVAKGQCELVRSVKTERAVKPKRGERAVKD